MNKVYSRINWLNYPIQSTPLNESNLNKIDYAVNELDDRVISMDTTKVNATDISNNIKSWTMDEETGVITITKYSGERVIFDLNIEKIPVSFTLGDDGILTMITDDGTRFTANIGSMIPILTFNDSDTIAVSVTGSGINKTYSFSVKNGSITEEKLRPNYLADIRVETATSTQNATTSTEKSLQAEGWAVGTQNGKTVGSSSPYYHNNAKYWKERAQELSQVQLATTEMAGIVKPDGTTITIDVDGTIHGANTYELPKATQTILGGVKVDDNTIGIDENGVIKVTSVLDVIGLKLINGQVIDIWEE